MRRRAILEREEKERQKLLSLQQTEVISSALLLELDKLTAAEKNILQNKIFSNHEITRLRAVFTSERAERE